MDADTKGSKSVRKIHICRSLALIVVMILVLIMFWYVREAPLPHKFP